MGLTSSSDNSVQAYSDQDRKTLLHTARGSIEHGLASGQPLAVDLTHYAPALQQVRASFVTLDRNDRLRGCIGMLEASRPLVVDVAHNAFAAAFKDPRFPPLANEELDGLEIHISVLGDPEPMQFESEQDLLRQLRPSVDGLILEEGTLRGTFLPSVWEQIPDPANFLARLKVKARLPDNYWSPMIRVWRYTTESFP